MARPVVLSVEDKFRLVVAVISGELTVAEAARRSKVSEQSIGNWKRQFLEGGKQGLADGGFVLPVICLTWPTLVVATRQVRGAMSEALAQDYVKAARARGIPERRVVWRHALRNSLLPVVTMLAPSPVRKRV